MTYRATVINIMIASPSDVAKERQIVRDVIHEWNAIHSADRKLVLVPIGWDSHSFPEMGDRPQSIINGQLLKDADILVAVFWTKFGTPTGKAGSGTEEEISEHLATGKPALLYFSSQPVAPDSVDPEQYKSLTDYKKRKMAEGLVHAYETPSEFRISLSRHLAKSIIQHFNSDATASEPAELPTRYKAASPALSDAARDLLVEASADPDGTILQYQTLDGYSVQTRRRNFVSDGDARTIAKWREAVEQLENEGLIEDRGGKRQVYYVTNYGYEIADRLSRGE